MLRQHPAALGGHVGLELALGDADEPADADDADPPRGYEALDRAPADLETVGDVVEGEEVAHRSHGQS